MSDYSEILTEKVTTSLLTGNISSEWLIQNLWIKVTEVANNVLGHKYPLLIKNK